MVSVARSNVCAHLYGLGHRRRVAPLVHRHDASAVSQHVDWSLLLCFAGLFVVTEGLRRSGAIEWLLADAER